MLAGMSSRTRSGLRHLVAIIPMWRSWPGWGRVSLHLMPPSIGPTVSFSRDGGWSWLSRAHPDYLPTQRDRLHHGRAFSLVSDLDYGPGRGTPGRTLRAHRIDSARCTLHLPATASSPRSAHVSYPNWRAGSHRRLRAGSRRARSHHGRMPGIPWARLSTPVAKVGKVDPAVLGSGAARESPRADLASVCGEPSAR